MVTLFYFNEVSFLQQICFTSSKIRIMPHVYLGQYCWHLFLMHAVLYNSMIDRNILIIEQQKYRCDEITLASLFTLTYWHYNFWNIQGCILDYPLFRVLVLPRKPLIKETKIEQKLTLRSFIKNINKFWLNGCWMDAFPMKEIFHLLGNMHVFTQIMTANMCRSDDFRTAQLSNVKFMNSKHTRDLFVTITAVTIFSYQLMGRNEGLLVQQDVFGDEQFRCA